jgi:NhaA family Na+:H+ antiporter
VLDPLGDFLRAEATGGMVLLAGTVAALIWANAATGGYERFWATELKLGFGSFAITEDLQHWINDGLMALFFFVVGLEIKRELVTGELNSRRAAALPVIAAVGGAALPAVIFLLVTAGAEGASGWAVPMATDIAFAVGVLALLGDRVSSGVKLFLLSLAVVDDLIAIAVIAGVYTSGVSLGWLAAAVLGVLTVVGMQRVGVAHPLAYLPIGLAVWVATLESGIHATVAGVALGLLTPARPVAGRAVLDDLEHRLHPVSSFVVIPLFALANAGLVLGAEQLRDAAASRLTWAIVAGLVLGKTLGIGAAAAAALRRGLGELPSGMRSQQIWGVAGLGGIGFTVSLFIAQLAFADPGLQSQAKIGIFTGSIASATLGVATLLALRRRSSGQSE